MPPLTIDTQGITPDLLQSDDNPILTDAIQEVINPTRTAAADATGWNNGF
ncbi:hypothetical protein [Actinomadura sp. KC216]|nr:hypothetical protein [Actinomadura sp. KC216]